MTDEQMIAQAAEAGAAAAVEAAIEEQQEEAAIEAAEERAEQAADLAVIAAGEADQARTEAYLTREELGEWQREQTDRLAMLEQSQAAILATLETLTALASSSAAPEPEPIAEPEPEPVAVEVVADAPEEAETASAPILSETPPTRPGYLGSVMRTRRR